MRKVSSLALVIALSVLGIIPASPATKAENQGMIALVKSPTGDLYAINADGSTILKRGDASNCKTRGCTTIGLRTLGDTRIEMIGNPTSSPQFSFDGTKLVYVKYGNIFTVNTDSSDIRQLTFANGAMNRSDWNLASGLSPFWSKDGNSIYYIRRGGGGGDGTLIKMTTGGSNKIEIIKLPFGVVRVFPSPDRRAVVYVGGDNQVYKMDIETGAITKLTEGAVHYSANWSPDGQLIAYEVRFNMARTTFVMNPDGSNSRQLADCFGLPVWSPDSTQIACGSPALDGTWIMNLDGSNKHKLLPSFGAAAVSWGPAVIAALPEVTQSGNPVPTPPNTAGARNPSKTPLAKIKSIICIKGKIKKIVRSTNPKCPKGFKLKYQSSVNSNLSPTPKSTFGEIFAPAPVEATSTGAPEEYSPLPPQQAESAITILKILISKSFEQAEKTGYTESYGYIGGKLRAPLEVLVYDPKKSVGSRTAMGVFGASANSDIFVKSKSSLRDASGVFTGYLKFLQETIKSGEFKPTYYQQSNVGTIMIRLDTLKEYRSLDCIINYDPKKMLITGGGLRRQIKIEQVASFATYEYQMAYYITDSGKTVFQNTK